MQALIILERKLFSEVKLRIEYVVQLIENDTSLSICLIQDIKIWWISSTAWQASHLFVLLLLKGVPYSA